MPYIRPACPIAGHKILAKNLNTTQDGFAALLASLQRYQDRRNWPANKTRFTKLLQSVSSGLVEIRSMLDNELFIEHTGSFSDAYLKRVYYE